jgi:excisionase family DNA binding protein
MEQLVTAKEAAEILGISYRRVHQLVDAGFLPEAGRPARVLLLRRADVEWLAREGWPGRRPREKRDP